MRHIILNWRLIFFLLIMILIFILLINGWHLNDFCYSLKWIKNTAFIAVDRPVLPLLTLFTRIQPHETGMTFHLPRQDGRGLTVHWCREKYCISVFAQEVVNKNIARNNRTYSSLLLLRLCWYDPFSKPFFSTLCSKISGVFFFFLKVRIRAKFPIGKLSRFL